MSLPHALPKQKCQPIFASTPSQHFADHVLDPRVVVLVAGEQRQPGAEILELEVLRAGLDERLHLSVEDRRERVAELLRVLVVLEVDVPGEVDRPGADRDLDRLVRVLRRDLVEVDQPDRPVGRRAAVDDAAPVGEQRVDAVVLALLGDRGVLLARRLEPADPLVHVPAEGADPADVVVVVHLAVCDDVEAGFLLVADHGVRGVVERLLVLDLLERDPHVAAAELLPEPLRPRV